MTLPATPRRAGPFTGNGVATAFPFTFKVFADTDLTVVKTTTAGLASTLVLHTDYTVSINTDQSASPGGSVSYASLASGELLSIVGNVPYDQTLDLPTVGNFNPSAIENALDRLVMQIQQLKEVTDRAALVPIGSTTTAAELANAIVVVAEMQDSLTTIATYAAASVGNVTQFSGNGSQTVFTLPGDPLGENNTQIFIGGVYQQKSQYSVSGAVISFNNAPAAGANNIEVVWPKTFAIGTPTPGTVTPASIGAAASADIPGFDQKQTYTAFTSTGTAPAYVLTPSPSIGTYVAGKTRLNVTFHAGNGGAATTLNVNGLGAVNLKQYDAQGNKINPLIVTGQLGDIQYDGTDFVILDPLQSPAGSANKNKFLNGAMSIDQVNAGAAEVFTAGAALAYCVDGWYAYCTGANVTGQQVAGTAPNKYNYRFTGAASVSKIGFAQRMEAIDTQDLAGTTASLSIDLANSLLTTVTWTAWYANTADTFGTLASPTRTQIATGTFTVNSTLTRYSTQISIPSAATTGIEVEFSVGAQTSGTWTIGRAQLEAGVTATPFEVRPIGLELLRCQRYYWEAIRGATYLSVNGYCYSTTQYSVPITFPVQMRVTPSLKVNDGSGYYTLDAPSSNALTNPQLYIPSKYGALIFFTVASGVAGYAAGFKTNNTNCMIAFDARL